MSSNLIQECASRAARREESEWGIEITDERLAINVSLVAPIVADVLDILTADGRLHATTSGEQSAETNESEPTDA